jgi:hypothetical protein
VLAAEHDLNPKPLTPQVLAAEHDLTARLFEAEGLHAQGMLSDQEFNDLRVALVAQLQ